MLTACGGESTPADETNPPVVGPVPDPEVPVDPSVEPPIDPDTPEPTDPDPVLPINDLDGDGIADEADADIDGDGVENLQDAFSRDPAEWVDSDGDGTGNNADLDDDNDGYPDVLEQALGADPLDALSVPADLDGDGTPDSLDSDRDGDGVDNLTDAFPDDATESLDTDNDGIGNNADSDDDNDGFTDDVELSVGTDPLDPLSVPADLDGDGTPDSLDSDRDGDGVDNATDAFPDDATESLDTDNDGVGNNADGDDDNDNFNDDVEQTVGTDPLDPLSVPADLDGDGIPDAMDDDRDGDGVDNLTDAFPDDPTRSEPETTPSEPTALDTELLNLVSSLGFDPAELTERVLPKPGDPLVELGKELFFSRSLSFGDDVACATCHDPRLAGTDHLSLSVGVGAHDEMIVGPGRRHDGDFYIDPKADFGPNVPRNSPTTFNIAFYDKAMFWDGRVETLIADSSTGYYLPADTGSPNGAGQWIRTPDSHFGTPDPDAGNNLVEAQARFPVTSVEEMRGFSVDAGSSTSETRELVAQKLFARGWETLFRDAFDDYVTTSDHVITYERIATALAEYQRSQVALDNPFFDYLSGNVDAISDSAKRGALAFFDKAKTSCADCHSGAHFSDENYHSLATPQIGRGKNVYFQDFGRYNVTAKIADKYAYRTPSLLNASVTAPYMHAGSLMTLEEAILWHYDPVNSLQNYDFSLDQLPQFEGLGVDTSLYASQVESIANTYSSEWSHKSMEVPPNTEELADLSEFVRSLTAQCMYDFTCLAQWMPDYSQPDPDGFRLEPQLAEFDNSEVFYISAPEPGADTPSAFPDLSEFADHTIEGCVATDIQEPVHLTTPQGFRKSSLAGFNDQHEITYEVLSGVNTLAESALVLGSTAAADIDGDCDMDVLVGLGKDKGIRVYMNEAGWFSEAEDNFGLDTRGDIAAFSLTDINGDGWPDLFVGHVYQRDAQLWLNRGGQSLVRVSNFGHETVRATHNAGFSDIDGDGDLDMFSSNWDFLKTSEEVHLWTNDGRGYFSPQINDGVYGSFGSADFTFTANFADMNGDHHADLMVAADFRSTQVFQGDGVGQFVNVTDSDVINDRNAMGAALGDYDNDGDLDWFVTNIQFPFGSLDELVNRFYRNDSTQDEIVLEEVSEVAGVQDGLWGWGTCMKDFDNDGWLDIFHVNGYGYKNSTFEHPLFDVLTLIGINGVYDLIDSEVSTLVATLYGYFGEFSVMNEMLAWLYPSEDAMLAELERLITASKTLANNNGPNSFMLDHFYGTPAKLFMNNQDGTFTESAEIFGIDDTGEGRGIACNDFDRDGDIDIVIMNHMGKPSYYENTFRRSLATQRNFINVRLQGQSGNTSAFGAKVWVQVADSTQYREMRFENNYMSNNAPELHFGLADAELIDEIRVRWPDASETVMNDVDVNQFLVLSHP